MSSGVRVLVAGDSQPLTNTLADFIQSQVGMQVVARATTAEATRHLLRTTPCDVVTTDLRVGGEDGLELVRSLLHEWPDLAIIVITAAESRQRIIEAIERGARGWVPATSPELVVDAIRGVDQGESRFPADALRSVLVERMRTGCSPEGEVGRELTLRELEVLGCLADGLTRAEISDALQLSPNTVRTYVRSILRKLHVHSSAAAIAAVGPSGRRGLPAVGTRPPPAATSGNDGPPISEELASVGSKKAPQ